MGRSLKQIDIDDIFKKVINLVKQGVPIRKALESLDVESSLFYRRATDQMKAELRLLKTSQATFSQGHVKGDPLSGALIRLNRYLMDPFTTDEDEEEDYI
jgi:type II secretory pathway component PulF